MIIRKPYALLIRNFKLIHAFMLIVSIYILYKTGIMLSFANDYVLTREVLSDITAGTYIPGLMYIAILLLLLLSGSIYILFKEKKKPVTFYLYHIIYNIIFIIFCIVSSRLILTIVSDGLDPRVARLFRDFWLIATILQVVFLGFIFIRAIGFDFKKFNFGEDLAQISIEEKDNEEVEINTEFNTEKAKMKIAMQKEELKAFFFEYKTIIIVILVLLFVVIPSCLIANKIVSSKIYSENEILKIKEVDFKVVESYVTKKAYDDDTLYSGDNSFLIVKFSIKNNTESDYNLVLNNIRLQVGNSYYLPTSTYNDEFIDIGTSYTNQAITSDSKEYIVVYTIYDDWLNDDLIIRYTSKLGYNKSGEATGKYYRIKLNPVNIDKDTVKNSYSLGDSIKIDNLGEATFKINNFEVLEYYIYDETNKKYIINNLGLILKVSYEYQKNDSSLSISSLLSKYASIRYTVDNRVYNKKIAFSSANGYSGNDLFLNINEDINNASSIEILFKVRNNEYTYKLK